MKEVVTDGFSKGCKACVRQEEQKDQGSIDRGLSTRLALQANIERLETKEKRGDN